MKQYRIVDSHDRIHAYFKDEADAQATLNAVTALGHRGLYIKMRRKSDKIPLSSAHATKKRAKAVPPVAVAPKAPAETIPPVQQVIYEDLHREADY